MISHVDGAGVRLAVREWGEAPPSIVALHPGVGDLRSWVTCAELWARAGHHVVAYDRRGFGETRCDPGPHRDTDDLDLILRHRTEGPVTLVGNSRGGGLALDFALARPERVAALVLVSPSPSGYPYDGWDAAEAEVRLDAAIEAAEAAGDVAEVNRLEVRYWLDGVDQPEGRVAGAARDLMSAMNERALTAGPIGERLEPEPAWPRIHECAVPTLVIVGEHDLPGCHVIGRQLAEAMPNATYRSLADSAHCPSLDQPRALAEAVLGFLAENR